MTGLTADALRKSFLQQQHQGATMDAGVFLQVAAKAKAKVHVREMLSWSTTTDLLLCYVSPMNCLHFDQHTC